MLLDKIKKQIDSHKVISFDIFDTLLLRPYVKPTDLFFHLEHLERIWWYRNNRIEAENIARQLHPEKEDITLDDIYEELEEPFKSLKTKELELEEKVLFANPEIFEIYKYAYSKKKKIIITSDMYLPQDFITKVLLKNGYDGYDKLYLSSTIGKTKWTGNLYKYILSDLGISGKNILHIGDNTQSDIEMAQKYKIDTVHYEKIVDRYLKQNKRAYEFYKVHSDEPGSSILLALSALSIFRNDNYWQNFGYQYGGPVLYGYMQWLDEKLKEDDIKEAMFVARDGYTLQKVFDIIKTTEVRSHYYYAPRIVNLVCNLNYHDYMKIDDAGGVAALRPILAYFKNKDAWLKDNTPEIKSSAEGDKFIQSNIQRYKRLANIEQKNYQNYLKPFKIQSKKVALIDTCSTMLSAQKSLMIGLPNKNIYGYYWFTWEGTQEDIQKYNTTTFQQSHRQEFIDWNIMEFFMTAPTPPAEKIEKGKVIFKRINPWEQKRIDAYPFLSEGMVNYAQMVHHIFGSIKLFLNDRILIDWVNILCQIPNKKDIVYFKEIQHAWDVEHTRYIPMPSPWFYQALKSPDIQHTNSKVLLFGLLPLFTKNIKLKTTYWKILGLVPILKLRCQNDVRTYKLFNFIPLLKIKYIESKLSDYPLKKVYLLGILPICRIKTELNMYGKEKTKFYLGNLRFLTIKRSAV